MSATLHTREIAFIGGGNMARALLGGLIAAGVDPRRIRVGEPDDGKRQALVAEFGVHTGADNRQVAEGADVVVLAVKPQVAAQALHPLKGHLKDGALIVSIMAGIRIEALRAWLGVGPTLVRAMPNTPALIGCGISVLVTESAQDGVARGIATALLACVGDTLWMDDEHALDAVTAVSGSGPAYLFRVMEAWEAAAIAAGLDPADARRLVIATCHGASAMASRGDMPPAALRAQVTSPGGTTEVALQIMDASPLDAIFLAAVAAATARGRQLAEDSGGATQ